MRRASAGVSMCTDRLALCGKHAIGYPCMRPSDYTGLMLRQTTQLAAHLCHSCVLRPSCAPQELLADGGALQKWRD
jgi:hypothetical protein